MNGLTFKGGVHPMHDVHEGKNATKDLPLKEYAAEQVVLSMRQNIGAECKPCVKKGDSVKLGQMVGEAGGFVSAPIHASVAGTVVAVEMRPHISGSPVMSVVIQNDGTDELDPSIVPKGSVDGLTKEELRKIIWDAGIVGMGGATFPTHVKLSVKDDVIIDYLILNGSECEPYLTSDHRMMLENAEKIIYGARVLAKACGAKNIVVGIEMNKPDAISVMEKAAAGTSVTIQPLQTKYPQGGEKQLIFAITGRKVPMGGLPAAVGAVVSNVSTAAAAADAVRLGMPLIRRAVTITGGVTTPTNFLLRFGTLIQDAIDKCGGFNGVPETVLAGGPMMGTATARTDVPITKGTNGVTVLGEGSARRLPEGNCMRCGRCVDACPMGLMPQTINLAYLNGKIDLCEELNAMNCMNCGSCTFICPAKRRLSQSIDLAKRAITAKAKR